MIQRLQTLYWSLAIVLVIVIFFVFDILSYQVENVIYSLKSSFFFYSLATLFILSALFALVNFKKLKLQLLISKLTIAMSLVMVIYIFIIKFIGQDILGFNPNSIKSDLGFYLVLLTLPLSFLAYSGVKRDKNLLDSLDRLR